MAHDHHPGHGGHAHHHHEHASAASIRHERPLWWALALIVLFAAVEAAAAFATNSLALLSDAAHMVTDAFALAVALVAVRLSRRPPDARRSFGYVRAEAMGALFNGLLLFALSGYILWEAAMRIVEPPEVASLGMLAVGVAGLLVNLVAMRLLHAGSEESLNVKGAYLEVWADMIGSLGVVAGALVIHFTGWRLADPLIAAAIGLWVLPRAWVLVRQAGNVLMMGVPEGIDLEQVRGVLAGLPGVEDVHDLHVWALASRQAAMTAHLVVDEAVDARALRHAAGELLHGRFGIGHATLQVETGPCHGPDCGAGHAGGHAWRPGPRGDRG